jgi:hypothetical protein
LLRQVSLALVLVALFVGACDSSPAMPVKKILVDVEPSAERSVDRERVRAETRALIDRDRGFSFDESNADGHVVRVKLFVATSGDPSTGEDPMRPEGHPETARRPSLVSLAVEISGARADPKQTIRSTGVAHAEGGSALDPLVADALRDAFAGILDARLSASESSTILIARVLDDKRSVRDREQAIRMLGQRREREAVRALLTTLEQEEEVLAPAALHALGQIGDASAVDAIIEYAALKPTPVRRAAIDAVRGIDTPRGRAWLFTLSTGHPDPDVQLAAATALGVLDARVAGDTQQKQQRLQ